MVQDQYYGGGYPGPNNMNPNMIPLPDQGPGMNMRPRMMHDNFRPQMHKGPPRGMGMYFFNYIYFYKKEGACCF